MATGSVENWGGNIADIGPIYPFVGSEFMLFILALVFWIGWHIVQTRNESKQYEEEAAKYAGKSLQYDDEY